MAASAGLEPLLGRVRLTDEPDRARELAARLPGPDSPRPVSVTDLLEPRRAFWRRRRGPAPMSPERELRLEAGRAWHRRLGDAFAHDGRLEVRIRRGGITGRIDLLSEVPVELKTGSGGPRRPGEPEPPQHIEQLAAYCALVQQPVGRLVHLTTSPEGPAAVEASDLRFGDLDAIARDLRSRERGLRAAVADGTPVGLARCRWYDAGCEYRAAHLCDCRGDEAATPSLLVQELRSREPRPDLARSWSDRLAHIAPDRPSTIDRFRDLLYPRRTYFRRTSRGVPEGTFARPPASPLDLYERTIAALETGTPGDLHRLPADPRSPSEEVLGWRGSPCLVRTTRVRSPLSSEDVRARFPQYLVDLGFRADLVGSPHGTLVVAHEHPGPGAPDLQVFDVDLSAEPGAFGRLWQDRWSRLDRALADSDPGRLESCPGWMVTDCPYRDACGCAEVAGRSQR